MSGLYHFHQLFPWGWDFSDIGGIWIVLGLVSLVLLVVFVIRRRRGQPLWPEWLWGKEPKRELQKVPEKRSDSGGEDPDELADDAESSPFNFTVTKRTLDEVKRRLDEHDTNISDLFRKSSAGKGRGEADFYNEVRQVILHVLQEPPVKQWLRDLAAGAQSSPSARPAVGQDVYSQQAQQRSHADRGAGGARAGQRGGGSGLLPAGHGEALDLYNDSVRDQGARTTFRERYKPVAISVVNATDRRRDENVAPDYQTSNDGNFLAVDPGSSGVYAVFPNFSIVLDESSYFEGAMGDVFKCDGFDRRNSYRILNVVAPATFEKRGDGGWKRVNPGVLNLGPPQAS